MSPGQQQRRRVPAGRTCCWLLLFLLWPAIAWPNTTIRVVLDPTSKTHEALFEQFLKETEARSRPGAETVIKSMAFDAADMDANTGSDLIITIGVKAASALQNHRTSAPILNILIPQLAHRQLAATSPSETAAIVLDQPVERQFAVARALLPYARQAGMLKGGKAVTNGDELLRAAARYRLDLEIVRITGDDNPANAIRQILADNDVIVSTFDHEAYKPATTKWLLYLAMQQKRPIIGFSYALLKAGATAAVFSTPQDIATHAAEIAVQWLETGVAPSGVASPRYYHVGINAAVAKRLGLSVPSEGAFERQVRNLLDGAR